MVPYLSVSGIVFQIDELAFGNLKTYTFWLLYYNYNRYKFVCVDLSIDDLQIFLH